MMVNTGRTLGIPVHRGSQATTGGSHLSVLSAGEFPRELPGSRADGSYPALQTIVPLMSVAQVEEDALETSENSNGDEDSSDAEGR